MKKLLVAIGAFLPFLAFAISDDTGPREIFLKPNLPCIVRVLQDAPIELPGLLPRMIGLSKPELALGWYVLPKSGAKLQLPPGKYRLEALAGLETSLFNCEVDLRKPGAQSVDIRLEPLLDFDKLQLVPGNTHLHLKNLTLDQADDYLRRIPVAEGLKVMFTSYLERFPDDRTYISNQYPIGPLPRFADTGILFNNGEEHRHNLAKFREGYGHVMFLNIKNLVQPVSTGPDITGKGFDDTPLSPGIGQAREQGGTVLWCHNTYGHERVMNVLQGKIDALNVFDGSRSGSFEENYYKFLNLGIRLPISTGTDWFLYDFSRVYAKVPDPLTIPSWLDAVKKGRCQATNGPILSLRVNDKEPGDTLDLAKPDTVTITASAHGRQDFQKLQLIHNGKVVRSEASKKQRDFSCTFEHTLRIDEPGWLAVRIESAAKNELDRLLFAHTSPVYVDLAGKRIFQVEDALYLVKQVEEGRDSIRQKASFSSPEAGGKILALYDGTIQDLKRRINQRQ